MSVAGYATSMDAQHHVRAWASQLGWTWPEGHRTPNGVYGAIAKRLGVSPGYVRGVYDGRLSLPAVWLERWPINQERP